MGRDLFRRFAESEDGIERNRRERWTLTLAVSGAITGAIGALTGILALAVTIARG